MLSRIRNRFENLASRFLIRARRVASVTVTRVLPARRPGASQHLLFIEDRVPHPHLGKGYPRSNVILWELVKMGYHVTLYPLVFADERLEEVHEDIPREVEVVLSGPAGLQQFLKDRRENCGIIFVSRPHNMETLRRCLPIGRWPAIIYDAEAIFAMRKIEERRVSGLPLVPREQRLLISQETALATGSRCITSVSDLESSRFAERGFKRVFTLGHSIETQPTPKPFGGRKDFLFVGPVDSLMTPNGDSVVWFAREVFPRLREQLGDQVRFLIAGHYDSAAAQRIGGAARFLGRVDDLAALYDSARVFVVPTRFSAGIPLKLLSAAAHGLPVVATPLAAWQLAWQGEKELLVGEGAEAFASQCLRLYTDQRLWNELRGNALARMRAEYSPGIFSARLGLILNAARRK